LTKKLYPDFADNTNAECAFVLVPLLV